MATCIQIQNAILLLALSATAFLGACNEQSKTGNNMQRNASKATANRQVDAAESYNPENPYPEEQWPVTRAAGGSSATATASDAATSTWTLVLGTFTGTGHAEAAHEMLRNLRQIAPQVTNARVHTTPKGSMVVYGHYTGREDPAARSDQERLKAITYQNQPVFNRIILARLDLRLTHGQLHPHDLLAARKANPNVNPLYTLDIAIWMSNDDPKSGRDRISFDEVKRKAEAYAAELRARREEAYFYHDDVNKWSIVTVNLFDNRAIHPVSKLYSNEVEALIARFPVRLANGEPLMEFRDRFNPKLGTVPQKPKLVLVPSM